MSVPCWICGAPVNYNAPPQSPDAFETDHYWPAVTHPHLAVAEEQWRPVVGYVGVSEAGLLFDDAVYVAEPF
ncbi:hypothetical protein [Mycobacterium sp.]|uniref:hypothetical protein n=1 Tax=Mycobacterium sp. TaxID=1785 RepID=UPI003F99BC5C